ncbi:hypothetical protein EYF80_003874 [Liparis tanakae]|uniref:Uncharacterized protein n=1 Tax=Liparis tanakae TaxID=230148 RepID=A0A4Z2J7G0_9TELE|nr:hypothetical protein EYF80_003874 [Liparis tanakae]
MAHFELRQECLIFVLSNVHLEVNPRKQKGGGREGEEERRERRDGVINHSRAPQEGGDSRPIDRFAFEGLSCHVAGGRHKDQAIKR